MPFDSLSTMGLAGTAFDDVSAFFNEVGHCPSEQQRAAIRDLIDHLELAAKGQLETALYVSAIPAGTGKSVSIAKFAGALTSSPQHSDIGMLILTNRITEAEDMAAMLEAHRDKLCIYSSDPRNLNATLSTHETADEAQVCIATQAALKATLRELHGAPFAAASRFHYRGQRRAVICWDEAFAFNRPVTLDADTVGGLARAMRRQSDEAANTLKRWTSDIDAHPGGNLCPVPDFRDLGVDFHQLEDDVADRDELVTQAKALSVVSGGEGYMTRHGAASVMITHYPEIPRSLLPVIVTDASARINPSYAQMAQHVTLRWLKDAPKTYRSMTIRIVPTAASRSAFRDPKTTRGRDLVDMAVRYIEAAPGEHILVISYKGYFAIRGVEEETIEGAIRARLKPEDRGRCHYLSYGRHTATNAFKHSKRVLLLGLNFLPKAAGHAASGTALNVNLIDQHPTDDQIKEMTAGMLKDATLQALLRGHARVSAGGDCGAMEEVIVQTKQTGLSRDDYLSMFPEATIVEDTVLMPQKPLKGHLAELDAIVVRRIAAGEKEMTNASLYAELGMKKQNFVALVKRPEWQARRTQLGLIPKKLNGRMMGLRLVA